MTRPEENKSDAKQGGLFGGADELYREVILDHFKSPRNRGRIEGAPIKAEGVNPFCGDQIAITALLEGDKIKDVKFEGRGCAISQSSASMMTSLIKGKSVKEAEAFTRFLTSIFGVELPEDEKQPLGQNHPFSHNDLGDLEALEGVKKYPVRIKCALLAWNTLLESLKNLHGK